MYLYSHCMDTTKNVICLILARSVFDEIVKWVFFQAEDAKHLFNLITCPLEWPLTAVTGKFSLPSFFEKNLTSHLKCWQLYV